MIISVGKVTAGLVSHWPRITDISGSPATGSRPGSLTLVNSRGVGHRWRAAGAPRFLFFFLLFYYYYNKCPIVDSTNQLLASEWHMARTAHMLATVEFLCTHRHVWAHSSTCEWMTGQWTTALALALLVKALSLALLVLALANVDVFEM